MLSAIAGSMSRAGGVTRFSAASDSVMLCATVNDGHDEQQLPHRAAQQQQPDEEEQVIGADQDVMDARGHELPDHSRHALTRACEVLEARMTRVEDHLRRQRVALVDVDERLVHRVVREHHGVDRDGTGRGRRRVANVEPDRLPILKDFGRAPLGGQRASVGRQFETWRQHRLDRGLALGHQRRFEQALGGRHLQIVRDVENVRDERHVDRRLLDLDVEVAERHWMRGCDGRDCQHTQRHQCATEAVHGESNGNVKPLLPWRPPCCHDGRCFSRRWARSRLRLRGPLRPPEE